MIFWLLTFWQVNDQMSFLVLLCLMQLRSYFMECLIMLLIFPPPSHLKTFLHRRSNHRDQVGKVLPKVVFCLQCHLFQLRYQKEWRIIQLSRTNTIFVPRVYPKLSQPSWYFINYINFQYAHHFYHEELELFELEDLLLRRCSWYELKYFSCSLNLTNCLSYSLIFFFFIDFDSSLCLSYAIYCRFSKLS